MERIPDARCRIPETGIGRLAGRKATRLEGQDAGKLESKKWIERSLPSGL